MIPIFETTPGVGYSFEDFERRFFDICQEHLHERRALAFAFIIYDFKNPEIAKVLRDIDYWQALDQIVGDRLSVFAVHFSTPALTRSASLDTMSLMIGVGGGGPTQSERLMHSHFGIKAPSFPAILFFQATSEGILDYALAPVKGNTIEATFNSIRDLLTIATESIAEVTPENYDHHRAIFALIKGRLETETIKAKILTGLKAIPTIKELLRLFS